MKSVRRLACKFVLDQSERKSSQVNGTVLDLAKRSCKNTEVYFRFVSFGQGLRVYKRFHEDFYLNRRYSEWYGI